MEQPISEHLRITPYQRLVLKLLSAILARLMPGQTNSDERHVALGRRAIEVGNRGYCAGPDLEDENGKPL